jgi:hypothetical protein
MVLMCGQERGPTGDAAGPYRYNSESAMILSKMLYLSRHARPPLCTAVTIPGERRCTPQYLTTRRKFVMIVENSQTFLL